MISLTSKDGLLITAEGSANADDCEIIFRTLRSDPRCQGESFNLLQVRGHRVALFEEGEVIVGKYD